ncbi:hypothetical protein [Desulfonatronospira sp. MSAO_Bac3]|uniref:hypothetical protein n=1 Tax=Desulfonatronospira sp. MSAO_Bac3 TaxID=2293857 RepID=UPI00257D69D3|nr:hypothetical protein [Desulfonatronospira sp. MSAO_Bac3]
MAKARILESSRVNRLACGVISASLAVKAAARTLSSPGQIRFQKLPLFSALPP